jgi:hypothetical protein
MIMEAIPQKSPTATDHDPVIDALVPAASCIAELPAADPPSRLRSHLLVWFAADNELPAQQHQRPMLFVGTVNAFVAVVPDPVAAVCTVSGVV